MRISLICLATIVALSSAVVIEERLGGWGQPAWNAPVRGWGPEVFIEQPHMVRQAPVHVIEPAPYGFDNYGNAIPDHPYAYINDSHGTTSIEDDVSHARAAPVIAAPAWPVAAPVWEPVVEVFYP